MRGLQIRRHVQALPPGTAVCVGAFDGLHLGHRALIDRARQLGQRVALVTFDPHPQRVLAPERPLRLLLDAAQRERTAAALGVDELVLLPFDADVAKLTPEAFVHSRLEVLAPAAVVVGADFRFGAQRRGDTAMLAALLQPAGIAVHVVEPIAHAEAPAGPKIGSSTIRDAIVRGDVALATSLLGRPHAVLGTVVTGDRRGRTIGIPTANLDAGDVLVPGAGVYAVWLTLWPGPAADVLGRVPLAAVANVGTNPTFDGSRNLRLEVHVFDRDLGESLYGTRVEVWFIARLRDEQRFPGTDALRTQIHADIAAARTVLAGGAEHDGVLLPPERP